MRLIDADALRMAMYEEAFENDDSYNETNPMAKWDSGLWIRYKMFENTIDKAPTIEPKQGEWIAKDGVFYCSCCDNDSAGLSEDDVYVYEIPLPNYCKDCGARMKGADNEGLL